MRFTSWRIMVRSDDRKGEYELEKEACCFMPDGVENAIDDWLTEIQEQEKQA